MLVVADQPDVLEEPKEDPRLRNDLLCVEWNDKPYTLTHALTQGAQVVIGQAKVQTSLSESSSHALYRHSH